MTTPFTISNLFIANHLDMLMLSKELAVIKCDVPIDVSLSELAIPNYTNDHIAYCESQQLNLLAKQLQKNVGSPFA